MKKSRLLLQVWAGLPVRDDELRCVRLEVVLTNAADDSLARRGALPPEQVRRLTVPARVEMGALRCVLPEGVRRQLGLETTTRRRAVHSDGRSEEVDVTEPVRIELAGRVTCEDCLVMGEEVLIGQSALESTDLLVDGVAGRLVPNPAHPDVIVCPVG